MRRVAAATAPLALVLAVPSAALAQGGGSFLVSPSIGLMLWTLIAFGITVYILRKAAFPRIAAALDKRRRAIEDSIDAAERTRKEADELLGEYRSRLSEAREQSEDIVARARKAADRVESESKEQAKQQRDEMLERTRREIESETQRALNEIRREVADLTVAATERVTRKALDSDDHRRLVDEALSDLDFSSLSKDGGSNGAGANGGARAAAPAGEDSGDRRSESQEFAGEDSASR
jgi:F-type H+-transporting ATPase subunit b